MLTRCGVGNPHELVSLAANWNDFPLSFVERHICLSSFFSSTEQGADGGGGCIFLSLRDLAGELGLYYGNINTAVPRLTLESDRVQN